jgi:hypothetical protein
MPYNSKTGLWLKWRLPLLDAVKSAFLLSGTFPGKKLIRPFWRDEEAVARWRRLETHRAAQRRGRAGVFSDYRLRVAAVLRDYGMDDRAEAPADSCAFHTGAAELTSC